MRIVAHWRCCAVRGGSRIEDEDRGSRICCGVVCALRKGEGGEESENVKVRLPLRSVAVAQWRCCAVRGGSRIEDEIKDLLRCCCALQKGEGGGESENVKLTLPLKRGGAVAR